MSFVDYAQEGLGVPKEDASIVELQTVQTSVRKREMSPYDKVIGDYKERMSIRMDEETKMFEQRKSQLEQLKKERQLRNRKGFGGSFDF